MNEASATIYSIPHNFLLKIISGLQIGLENTEEIFVTHGSRQTRTERANAQRLEEEMIVIGNLITELKTFL